MNKHLWRAMLDTAIEMLAEQDGWQFTLRKLARRTGVSHTASYKHFPDKAGLLADQQWQFVRAPEDGSRKSAGTSNCCCYVLL